MLLNEKGVSLVYANMRYASLITLKFILIFDSEIEGRWKCDKATCNTILNFASKNNSNLKIKDSENYKIKRLGK